MTGWQRFFLLLVCMFFVLMLWPQYDAAGWTFLLTAGVMWTCVIILLSVLSNIFGIYKFEFLNRLVSLLFLGAMLASLLMFFPLKDGQTPLKRMQANHWPTLQDAREGIERMTFNFDFVRRNVHRDANYINQKLDDAADETQKIKKKVQKKKEQFEVVVEQLEGEE